MTLFWTICALLLALAILFVAIPLWRGKAKNNAVVRDAANLEIYRDQLVELGNDLQNGLLTQDQYEQAKREIESRVLDEAQAAGQMVASATSDPFKRLTLAIAVMLPLLSVGTYLMVGNQNAFLPQPVGGMGGAVHTEAGIQALEERAADNPEDPEVLLMLARSYVEAGRYADGAQAYDKLTKLVPDEAMLWADYADALAMTHNSLQGGPTKLLDRALLIDPEHAKSLALSGTAAMERGDYAAAIRHWERLRRQLQDGSEEASMIDEGLHMARQFLAQSKGGKATTLEQINQPTPSAKVSGSERISGTVTLSSALKGKAAPEDTLFVLARAAQGPKMPLAILRMQVKDLPLNFELDDSMAMSPEMTLSSFDQVVVVARVSKSGTAMPQAGDLQGMSQPLKPGSKGIKIVIDQTVQ